MTRKKMMMNKWLVAFLFTLLSTTLHAVESIKIGMSAALTGTAAELGLNMRLGIESYFAGVNAQGGVNGRPIELIVKDDGYEPERAAMNMRALIDQDNVLAVIGNVGTPTAIVTVPIAQQKQTLLFGAFSGGDVLRPAVASRYIINYRASYKEETVEMVNGLLAAGIMPQQIAFFTQGDGYGDAAYQGATNALHQVSLQNTEELVHGRYTRNTLNVENAVAKILDSPIEPKAIIMAAGYKPAAKFIKLVKQEIPDMLFLNLSFVGSYALRNVLGEDANNVIITQVVPNLDSQEAPIVEEFFTSLKRFSPDASANFVSLEGFIIAKLFHKGLLNAGANISKEGIIDGIEMMKDEDIGLGTTISYGQKEHQAVNTIWLTRMNQGVIELFDWSMLQDAE